MIKEVFGTKSWLPNHSTVTDLSERVKCETSNIFLQFTITVSSSNLNNYFYSEHQQYLYDTIKELHGKGLGYRKISDRSTPGPLIVTLAMVLE